MDFTPAITNYNNRNYYTIGHKAALPIMFESGIQCMSDKPANYRSTAVYELYKNLPAAWDESRLLGGVPGSFAIMYRRSGDTAYVAIIGNEKRTIDLQADFIDKTMQAELFLDGADEDSLKVTREILNKNDIITIPLAEHGGALIKLTPGKGISGINSHWCNDTVSEMNSKVQLCGYFAADFKPDELITRGEFVMMLTAALNISAPSQMPPFTDSTDHRAKNHIAAAVNQEIINGYDDGSFLPHANITRAETAAILSRAAKSED